MKPVVCCKCGSPHVIEHVSGENKRRHQRPYCRKHWAEYCNGIRRKSRMRAVAGRPLKANSMTRKQKIVAFVREYWQVNGYGPFRWEVESALGVKPKQLSGLIHDLRAMGVLTSNRQHRSLRVVDRAFVGNRSAA